MNSAVKLKFQMVASISEILVFQVVTIYAKLLHP